MVVCPLWHCWFFILFFRSSKWCKKNIYIFLILALFIKYCLHCTVYVYILMCPVICILSFHLKVYLPLVLELLDAHLTVSEIIYFWLNPYLYYLLLQGARFHCSLHMTREINLLMGRGAKIRCWTSINLRSFPVESVQFFYTVTPDLMCANLIEHIHLVVWTTSAQNSNNECHKGLSPKHSLEIR